MGEEGRDGAGRNKDNEDDGLSDGDDSNWSMPSLKKMYPFDSPPEDLHQAWFSMVGLKTKPLDKKRIFKELLGRGDTPISKTLFLVVARLWPRLYMRILGMVRNRLCHMDEKLWSMSSKPFDKRELSSTKLEYQHMMEILSKTIVEEVAVLNNFPRGTIERQFVEIAVYGMCRRECAALAPYLRKRKDKTIVSETPWSLETRMIVSFQGVNDFRGGERVETRMPKQIDTRKVDLSKKYLVVAYRACQAKEQFTEYYRATYYKPLAFKLNQLSDWDGELIKLSRLIRAINEYWQEDLEADKMHVGMRAKDLRLVWLNSCNDFGSSVYVKIKSSQQLTEVLKESVGTWEDSNEGLWLYIVEPELVGK